MKRVLIVEDEPDSREMLAEVLTSEGYDVSSAENGLVGLEFVRSARVDLIITDVMMPFMDGAAMLAEIHRDPGLRAIPVIILTAADGADLARRFSCALMRKPIRIDAFLRLVRQVLGA